MWGGSTVELDGRGLAADFNIKTNRAPIAAMVGPEDKKLEIMFSFIYWQFSSIAVVRCLLDKHNGDCFNGNVLCVATIAFNSSICAAQ